MSDWRQSRPEDFALTEKRGPAGRGSEPPRRQGPDWLLVLLAGVMLGTGPTLALTWLIMSPSSDAGLRAQLIDQAKQIDNLNADVTTLKAEKETIQKRADDYAGVERHIETVCQNVWVPDSAASRITSVVSKKTFCQSFVQDFPGLFSP